VKLSREKCRETFLILNAKRMIAFSSRDHLYVTALTAFIKGSTSLSQIVKSGLDTEKVGNHWDKV